MINAYIEQYREWFNAREKREKVLVFIASWAVIYALFTLLLFNPIGEKNDELRKEVTTTSNEIKKTEDQLKFLNEIPNTPIYKDWVKQNQQYQSLKKEYAALLTTSTKERWEEIIRTILASHPNINMVSISQLPETTYASANAKANDHIYEQQMRLIISGNFVDIVAYLQALEKALINIHWNSLDYKVTEYPNADVTMEFSILYEKKQ